MKKPPSAPLSGTTISTRRSGRRVAEISLTTLRWMIDAIFQARPMHVGESLEHWLNALAELATAYEEAGGRLEDLAEYERDGLRWSRSASDGGIAASVTFRG